MLGTIAFRELCSHWDICILINRLQNLYSPKSGKSLLGQVRLFIYLPRQADQKSYCGCADVLSYGTHHFGADQSNDVCKPTRDTRHARNADA